MATVSETIAALGRFAQKIAVPAEFYEQRRERYLFVARQFVESGIIARRPQNADPAEWAEAAKAIRNGMDAVAAFTYIRITARQVGIARKGEEGQAAFSLQGKDDLTREDLIAWIEAGQRGEPGGKNLTDEEAQMDPEEVAARVEHRLAHTRKDPSGLVDAVARFLDAQGGGKVVVDPGIILGAMGDARAGLGPLFKYEFEAYVRQAWANP